MIYGEKNGSFRILVLGSSTVYADHFSLDAKTAWPYQLEVAMNSFGFSDIEVINAGFELFHECRSAIPYGFPWDSSTA